MWQAAMTAGDYYYYASMREERGASRSKSQPATFVALCGREEEGGGWMHGDTVGTSQTAPPSLLAITSDTGPIQRHRTSTAWRSKTWM